MTTDFCTEHDEKLAEGKLMAFNARIMARWFATVHDDTIALWQKDDHNVDNLIEMRHIILSTRQKWNCLKNSGCFTRR